MYQPTFPQPSYDFVSRQEYEDVLHKNDFLCNIVHEMRSVINHLEVKINVLEANKKPKQVNKFIRCIFFNRGYCKRGRSCLYEHGEGICQEYIKTGQCMNYRSCIYRHPRSCRYWKEKKCFRGDDCLFLHGREGNVLLDRNPEIITIEVNDKTKEGIVVIKELEEDVVQIDETETDPNFEDKEKEDPAQLTVEEIMKFYESDQYDSTMNVGKDILEILDVEDNADSNDDK